MNTLITNILKPLNVPIAFQFYNGTATTFIVFSIINERPSMYADNEPLSTEYSIQVGVWSKSVNEMLVTNTLELLKANKFRHTYITDVYDETTKYYGKIMNFNYVEYV